MIGAPADDLDDVVVGICTGGIVAETRPTRLELRAEDHLEVVAERAREFMGSR